MRHTVLAYGHVRLGLLGLILAFAAAARPLISDATEDPGAAAPPAEAPPVVASLPPAPTPPRFDAGRSGALEAAMTLPGAPTPWKVDGAAPPLAWYPVDTAEGTTLTPAAVDATGAVLAPAIPGAYRLGPPDAAPPAGPVLFVKVPFEAKQGGKVDRYVLGTWPGEAGTKALYPLPDGFVRMTPALEKLPLSPRLTLGAFKTKNQAEIWPKYLVLSMDLVDKMELIASDLRQSGLPSQRLFVMSGFRTPSYNAPGVGAGGRATYSRHQFGDAADFWVDDDRDGRLDDLNRDGHLDTRDVEVLLAAQSRVEAAHPALVGGGGVYKATSAHGPFLHVDVRGTPARWTYHGD